MLIETIEAALGPVFLLVATGSILNVLTGRLARAVDRSRVLIDRHGSVDGVEHQRIVTELRNLDTRMTVINGSIALCVSCGIVVCVMVAMLFLLGSGQAQLETPISASFIVAMSLLFIALVLFLVEVRLTIRSIHVPMELLEDRGHD